MWKVNVIRFVVGRASAVVRSHSGTKHRPHDGGNLNSNGERNHQHPQVDQALFESCRVQSGQRWRQDNATEIRAFEKGMPRVRDRDGPALDAVASTTHLEAFHSSRLRPTLVG